MIAAITPLELAEAIVRRDGSVMVLDIRTARSDSGPVIPGAIATGPAVAPAGLGPGVTVVLYDETGAWTTVPLDWPAGPGYRYLAGGLAAWRAEVLTPVAPAGGSLDDQARVARQHALAAFFSGAAAAAPAVTAPPVLPAAGGAKKKRVGGC
jgi:hypothetical protein